MFQNLIANAIRFRKPDDDPHIRIRAERFGAAWRFSVQDNGIGFDSKHAEQIFVIFQRLHGFGTYPGTGIGLDLGRIAVEFRLDLLFHAARGGSSHGAGDTGAGGFLNGPIRASDREGWVNMVVTSRYAKPAVRRHGPSWWDT